jgi:hypothetical protein
MKMTRMSAEREEYLESLAEEYDVPIGEVKLLAEILGEDEDYDGLVSTLEDAEALGMFHEEYDLSDEDEEDDVLDLDEDYCLSKAERTELLEEDDMD